MKQETKAKIKSHLEGFLELIKQLLLLIIGVFFFVLLAIVGIIYSFIKHLIKKDYSVKRQLVPIIRSLNLLADGFACASAGELLNDIAKVPKNNKIKYGSWSETISAISGLLKLNNQDNKIRKFVDGAFSLFEKNHCENAITEQQKVYYLDKS